ncbi:MAG: hypothetical protein JNJ94_00230 [Chlorobi bacterium]|nr:hypothetical protein [Chlorobiota bacterium]
MQQIKNLIPLVNEQLRRITADGETSATNSSRSQVLTLLSQMSSPVEGGESPTQTGLELSLVLGQELVSEATFTGAMKRLGLSLGVDYTTKAEGATNDQAKALVLWERVRKLGWSNEEFEEAFEPFINRTKFPSWATADFISGYSPPKIYPYSWYQDRVKESRSNADAIGCYRVEGHPKPVWGWKHEVRDLLPEWTTPMLLGSPQEEQSEKGEGREVDVTSFVRNLKDYVRADELQVKVGRVQSELERVEAQRDNAIAERELLRREVATLQRALETARANRRRLEEEIKEMETSPVEELEKRILDLEMALAAVLHALEEDREAARIGEPQTDVEAWTPEINRLRAVLDPQEATRH